MRISDWSSDVCSSDLQHDVAREDPGSSPGQAVQVTAADLLAPSRGTITRAGFDGNVEVCVRYLDAWLDGNGCVPIHHLMEDAATAEIARAPLWPWLHGDGVLLDAGSPADFYLPSTGHASRGESVG